jgi:hypothetical protein
LMPACATVAKKNKTGFSARFQLDYKIQGPVRPRMRLQDLLSLSVCWSSSPCIHLDVGPQLWIQNMSPSNVPPGTPGRNDSRPSSTSIPPLPLPRPPLPRPHACACRNTSSPIASTVYTSISHCRIHSLRFRNCAPSTPAGTEPASTHGPHLVHGSSGFNHSSRGGGEADSEPRPGTLNPNYGFRVSVSSPRP